MNRSLRRAILPAALALSFAAGHEARNWHMGEAAAAPVVAANARLPAAAVALPDFTAIAAAEGPAVVNISVSGTAKVSSPFDGMDPDSPFFDFFRQFGVPGAERRHPRVPMHALGSGFIVDPDGIILTNAHVVNDADSVTVRLTDKREFKAKVVGLDKKTDVAVLRIKARNLPVVSIGDPGAARVGEWVVAIGSPFGFDNTVTAGIISAKSRMLPDEDGYVPFLQTDVAINPGNSGGPLMDASGRVIGINSQIYSESGGYQGLSFAIPIDVAMNVEHQIVTSGKVSRGKLGVAIQDVNQGLAESFGLDKPRGALVSSVEPGSAAAKAGVQPGDIVLAYNGKEISQSSDLPALVGGSAPGSQASLDVWRGGERKRLTLTVGDGSAVATASSESADASSIGGLGLAVRPLSPDERRQAGQDGLLVDDVSDGPAARAGVQPGDIIVAVNGSKVRSLADLKGQLARHGKGIALLVRRGDASLFVPIRTG
ncbi:MAG TPA: DegQ family serine endoprotease [Rhodocyclaceae bacterium]